MVKLEKILGITVLIALLLKFGLIPGGGILFTFSLIILSCLYYPMGFALLNKIELRQIFKKNSYKGLTLLRIVGSIGVGIALSAVCIGILFKIQHWKGGNENLMVGLLSTLILFIITLLKYFKIKAQFYVGILRRVIIIGGLGLAILCISDLTIIKIRFRNHPDYIKAYQLYLKNPHDKDLQTKMQLEWRKATMSHEAFENYLKQEKN